MKRNEIVKKLISEGFSINTLATMSDKQIGMLGERILSEQSQPAGTLTVPKNTDVEKIKTLTSQGLNVKQEVKEDKPSSGLSTKKKSEIVKKAKKGEDIGKKGKGFEKVVSAAKKSGAKDPEAVAAASMWKNIKREEKEITEVDEKKPLSNKEVADEIRSFNNTSYKGFEVKDGTKIYKFEGTKFAADGVKKCFSSKNGKVIHKDGNFYELHILSGKNQELKEWVEDLVNQNYHPFTSKGEIMGMIQTKLDEQETMIPMPTSKPTKGHNGIPEWLSYDAIKGDGGSTVTAPVKTPAKTKPGEKPKTRNPYQPGPGINPNPKAKL